MKQKMLSTRAVQTADIGWRCDGAGLYLQTTRAKDGKTLNRSWVLRYKIAGRERYMGLGPAQFVTLGEARAQALECRKLLLGGTDPLERKRSLRQQAMASAATSMTFQQAAEQYIRTHEAGWVNDHCSQWRQTLRDYVFPVLGPLSMAAIDTALVLKCLEPIWSTKPETASRTRGRIESILDWAKVRGYRAGDNPARWRGHLDHLLPAVKKVAPVVHHAALPFDQIPDFMAATCRSKARSVR
jgi:hypothetical protein